MSRKVNFRKSQMSIGEKATLLLVGGGIGAAVALLLAPKSGEDLREEIAGTTRQGIKKSREAAVQIGERAGEYYEVARDRAGEYYDTAAEKARLLAENARDVAASRGNTLSAAIEAGKQAYYEEKRRSEARFIKEGRPNYPRKLSDEPKGNLTD